MRASACGRSIVASHVPKEGKNTLILKIVVSVVVVCSYGRTFFWFVLGIRRFRRPAARFRVGLACVSGSFQVSSKTCHLVQNYHFGRLFWQSRNRLLYRHLRRGLPIRAFAPVILAGLALSVSSWGIRITLAFRGICGNSRLNAIAGMAIAIYSCGE